MEHEYDDFYENETIRSIANKRRWSISTKDKKPVDMHWLLDVVPAVGVPTDGSEPPGARVNDPTTMATLDEIRTRIPNAANAAFYLCSGFDGIVVLDVEPCCDPALKEEILDLKSLYRERSMSGLGYHLVFPEPKGLLAKYPNAAGKHIIKKRSGDYEVHFEHWVTFTRNNDVRPGDGSGSFEKFIAPLFRAQKPPVRYTSDIEVDPTKALALDQLALVEELAGDPATVYPVSPSQMDDDMSRWEFGYVGHIMRRVLRATSPRTIGSITIVPDVEATPEEVVLITYAVAKRLIPYRKKHDTYRVGYPWLLYQAKQMYDRSQGERGDGA